MLKKYFILFALTLDSWGSHHTGIAASSLTKDEISVTMQSIGQGNAIIRAQKAFFPEGVVIERSTVVLVLDGATGPTFFDIIHP